jgi:hypothetical protein
VATGQPPSPNDTCLGKGATTQYNEAAAQQAHDDVLVFLNEAFAQR